MKRFDDEALRHHEREWTMTRDSNGMHGVRPARRRKMIALCVVCCLSLFAAVGCDDDEGSGGSMDTTMSDTAAGDTSAGTDTSTNGDTSTATDTSTGTDTAAGDTTTGDTAAADTTGGDAEDAPDVGDTTNDVPSDGTDATDAPDATDVVQGDVPSVMTSCDEAGLEMCVLNADCPMTHRCQDIGQTDPVPCCVEGERGTGQAGDSCSQDIDCESGLCTETSDGSFVCSRECQNANDCPESLPNCTNIAFVGKICTQ